MTGAPYESAAASATDPAEFNVVCRSKSNLPNRTDLNAALLLFCLESASRRLIHKALRSDHLPNLNKAWITVMYFSYNGTRDWLKTEWRDLSCMKLEVSLLKINNKNSVTFRSTPYAFNLRETGFFERVSSAKIYFLPFLRDTCRSYEIPLNWSNSPGENLPKYKH